MTRRAEFALGCLVALACLPHCGGSLPEPVAQAAKCLETELAPRLGARAPEVARDILAGRALERVAFDHFLNTQDLNRVRDAVLACAPKVIDS